MLVRLARHGGAPARSPDAHLQRPGMRRMRAVRGGVPRACSVTPARHRTSLERPDGAEARRMGPLHCLWEPSRPARNGRPSGVAIDPPGRPRPVPRLQAREAPRGSPQRVPLTTSPVARYRRVRVWVPRTPQDLFRLGSARGSLGSLCCRGRSALRRSRTSAAARGGPARAPSSRSPFRRYPFSWGITRRTWAPPSCDAGTRLWRIR